MDTGPRRRKRPDAETDSEEDDDEVVYNNSSDSDGDSDPDREEIYQQRPIKRARLEPAEASVVPERPSTPNRAAGKSPLRRVEVSLPPVRFTPQKQQSRPRPRPVYQPGSTAALHNARGKDPNASLSQGGHEGLTTRARGRSAGQSDRGQASTPRKAVHFEAEDITPRRSSRLNLL